MRCQTIHAPRRIIGLAFPALLAALLALSAASCAHTPRTAQTASPEAARPETQAVSEAYAKAVRAFAAGDFQSAAALFESLSRPESRDCGPACRARAMYGLACSLLAKAASREEMDAALEAWQQWRIMAGASPDSGDARMLTPFLHNPNIFPRQKGQRQPEKSAANDQDLLKRLQAKEKQVQHLQRQIKALEAIHQEIQEKKKMSN